jgi:hypothetical protein
MHGALSAEGAPLILPQSAAIDAAIVWAAPQGRRRDLARAPARSRGT